MENVETGAHCIESEASPTLLPLQQPSGRKRKGLPSSEEQLAVDTAVKIINDTSLRCKNPYSGFGEHVANKLATYDNYTRSQVEFKVSKILYEADMQTSHTKFIIIISINLFKCNFAATFRRHRNISRLVIVKISLFYMYIRISIKAVELTLINSFKLSISASQTSGTMQHIEEICTLKRYIKVLYESPVATKRSVIANLVVIGMELLIFVSLLVILGPIAFNKHSKSLFDILVKFLKR